MNSEKFVKVAGTGTFLPGDPIPFADMEKYLGEIENAPSTVLKWLKRIKPLMSEMLDIDYLHYAIDPDTKENSEDHVTMSVKAAKTALEHANVKAEDIDLITYGSAFMQQIPPTSTRIQEELGIDSCTELSVHSNCTSSYKALMIAHDMIKNGRFKKALVVSTSMNSSILKADFYNQSVLKSEDVFLRYFLCDGSSAIVLEAADDKSDGLFLDHTFVESVGGNKASVMYNGFPPYWVGLHESFEKGHHHIIQKFDRIKEQIVEENGYLTFTNGLQRMIQQNDIDVNDVKYFQINMPAKHVVELILSECEELLGLTREKVYTKISKIGYAGPPAAFIALDKIVKEEKLEKDEMILSFVTEVSKFMQAGFTITQK